MSSWGASGLLRDDVLIRSDRAKQDRWISHSRVTWDLIVVRDSSLILTDP